MVWDFFKNLGRQKMTGVQASMKGKVMGAQAKAKMKAAAKVNKGIKSAGDKAKGAAKGAASKGKGGAKEKAAAGGEQKGDNMGLFGKKKRNESAPAMPVSDAPEAAFGDKTQFIQAIEDDKPKPCVGWLVALNGALKGLDFRIVDGKNIIGTAADADIVLTDQYMSSRHAVLRHEEGVFTMVDLDSTNGTYVNESRVSKEELIDNDKVRLGRTELKFKSLY